jgi:hypothetical protein
MLRASAVVWLLGICAVEFAHADPWLAPGDERLRADVQLLADAGILHGPITTWPMSWPDIARDALGASESGLDEATANALLRVQRLSRAASMRGFAGIGLRASGAYEPAPIRGFAETPREEGEIALRASWLSQHFAMNLQGTVAFDPDDGKQYRPDGSYVGVNIGNYMISAGFMERWWGPGWDGSLILSSNARPIPSVTLERNYTDPFKTKLLSWIGPWRASIAVGEAESGGVAVPDVRFLAARLNFKPRPWLELGLTRTAQWCGGDRQCNWQTFRDLLIGRDNQTDDSAVSARQPGNQMAGYDMRLRSPWNPLALAVYAQFIGEDEAGGLPSKFLGLFGLESWGTSRFGAHRVRVEYADTACNFSRQEPEFGCGYRNAIYPQGYAFRGRTIGHTIDNDSRMYSLGAILTRPGGNSLSLTLRRLELNRDGGVHPISTVPADSDNVELRYSRALRSSSVIFGIAYFGGDDMADSEAGMRGFITWQQGF